MEETPSATIAKEGLWTVDELATYVPSNLMRDIRNPAPPAPDLDLPGPSRGARAWSLIRRARLRVSS